MKYRMMKQPRLRKRIGIISLWKEDYFDLTLVFNFINILRAQFLYNSAFLTKYFCPSQNVTRKKLCESLLYKKGAHRTLLMKLTLEVALKDSKFYRIKIFGKRTNSTFHNT